MIASIAGSLAASVDRLEHRNVDGATIDAGDDRAFRERDAELLCQI
jgi:hypothetical protein